jgi:hypothetical protein
VIAGYLEKLTYFWSPDREQESTYF